MVRRGSPGLERSIKILVQRFSIMPFTRSSGILLHPTSLPGPYGIGELGSAAMQWLDWLAGAGCGLWQILPLGPTGYGDSPYQSFSSFAGNPYLISLERLLEEELLVDADLDEMPESNEDQIDYGAIYEWKLPVLDKAYARFLAGPFEALRAEQESFRQQQAHWLDDFALFMALKEAHDGEPWNDWPPRLRARDPGVLERARQVHVEAVERQIFRQFLFFRQWAAVRSYANQLGIRIIGDVPIFVAYDSADVWANQDLFHLDAQGSPTVVAGVPPDYFSETGQLWGNPLYRWELHAARGYDWWLARLQAVLSSVDIIRLDHFRGFYDYWEIPAGQKTAVEGRWVEGPREAFFQTVRSGLARDTTASAEELPIIAEDLGELNPGVYELRDRLDLPGMKIMVFAFSDDGKNEFLPHNHVSECVVYTGTHDNDTARGWFERVSQSERDFALRYLDCSEEEIPSKLIRAAWGSVSIFALTSMPDLLGLGNEARMNYPGRETGNWGWRMRPSVLLDEEQQERLRELNLLFDRLLVVEESQEETE